MSKCKRATALAIIALADIAIAAAAAPDWIEAGNLMWVLLMIKAWLFVVLYALRSRWRLTAGGRGIMRLVACIAVIGTLSSGTILLGDYPGRAFVRLALIASVALALADLLLTLIAAQQDDSELRR